ncbi:MAG TPA: tRNA pseudouridine(55) synthase TruB [Desulfobulbaceae bacterium]|nr:tRNA pseudouridine(55) synthase TruB [Desulfobulbaceae bacterium]
MAGWEPVVVEGQPFSAGVMLIDKPTGITSFGIVRKVRRLLGVKKVGHAGTLDPFAGGLLIVCAGRGATKHIEQFMQGRKKYRAILQLGVETETQDREGRITAVHAVPELNRGDIERCLKGFVGPQLQAPPPFSAAKHKGKPLYHYARKGIMIRKEPKAIEIYTICCLGYDERNHLLDCEITCSRGTYIRVLAADIGENLGCGAHLHALRRTQSGRFTVEGALAGTMLDAENALELLLSGMMTVDQALACTNE